MFYLAFVFHRNIEFSLRAKDFLKFLYHHENSVTMTNNCEISPNIVIFGRPGIYSTMFFLCKTDGQLLMD